MLAAAEELDPGALRDWPRVRTQFSLVDELIESMEGDDPGQFPDVGALAERQVLAHGEGVAVFDPSHFDRRRSVHGEFLERSRRLRAERA